MSPSRGRRASLLIACCFLGACARGKAGLSLLDASTGTIHGLDGSAAGQGDGGTDPMRDGGQVCELPGECSTTQDASQSSQPDGQVGEHDAHVAQPDAGPHDAQVSEPDANTSQPDAGGPGTRTATFRVRQMNSGLQQPLDTGMPVQPGDTVHITGSGNIWPGLFGQGCCGPDGTSGTHSGSDWPLNGGPDFALIAHVNGAWTLVASDRTFLITQAGTLQLATDDNDNSTGDDCTSVPDDQRGYAVHVEITTP
jgi:hypothetical protein